VKQNTFLTIQTSHKNKGSPLLNFILCQPRLVFAFLPYFTPFGVLNFYICNYVKKK